MRNKVVFMNKSILYLIVGLTLSISAIGQPKTNFGIANANINVCSSLNSEEPPNGQVASAFASATNETGNASASFTAMPGLKLKAKSKSTLFGLSCKADANGSWDVKDLMLTGNNSVNIPLDFNFRVKGSVQITTSQGGTISSAGPAGCFSIAGILTYSSIFWIGEQNFGTKDAEVGIQYINGVRTYYYNNGMTTINPIGLAIRLNVDGSFF